ncbi:MAG: hypothetical protein RR313_02165 [Anaerovoracaceae bacterium]
MENNKFTLIYGGLSESSHTSSKVFESSYITDTRLMGVVGMYIHWSLPDNPVMSDFHQFFYFDAEEYGFETYQSTVGNNKAEITEIERSLIGGLGGEKIPLTEVEACFMVQHYVAFNKAKDISLPEGKKEYDFILNIPAKLTDPESYILLRKQCTKITSVNEAINYFLMRCFGKDFAVALFLASSNIKVDLFPELKDATLCKNAIDDGPQDNSYICESLIEYNDNYHIVITHIVMENLQIKSFERVSTFKVSSAEAAMMLSRPEFITLYEFLGDVDMIDHNSFPIFANAVCTSHPNGELYMVFNPSNKHVDKRVFRLNEDVLGLYFICDEGQILIASYSLDGIRSMEADLKKSSMYSAMVPLSKYEFKEPVLYEFISSGLERFEDFVELIKDENE